VRRLAFITATAAAIVAAAVPTAGSAARGVVDANSVEPALLQQINAVRREHGLALLRLSRPLIAAADSHSREMAIDGFFAHESHDGSLFASRVAQYYPARAHRTWSVGENLAWASPDLGAAATLSLWMHSPGHRKNLLNPAWREIGISAVHVAAASGIYGGLTVTLVTADFGVRA
jgi:uncharacterized protein YkwD